MILTNHRLAAGTAADAAAPAAPATPATPASRSSPTRRPRTASSALTPIRGTSPHGTSPKGGPHNIRSASTSSSSISNSMNLNTPTAGAAGGSAAIGAPATGTPPLRRTSEATLSAAPTEASSAPFADTELAAALDAVAAGGPAVAGALCEGRYAPLGADQRRQSGNGLVQFAVARETGEHVALKFFSRRAAFLRTEALYKHSALREFMPHIIAIETLADDEDSGTHSVAIGDNADYTFPPCIVMERGQCLREWAMLQRPEFEQRLQVLAVIAERVSLLHAAGFGHRNLKPENILFRPRDQTWRLIDFANAARLGAALPRTRDDVSGMLCAVPMPGLLSTEVWNHVACLTPASGFRCDCLLFPVGRTRRSRLGSDLFHICAATGVYPKAWPGSLCCIRGLNVITLVVLVGLRL